MMVEVTSLLLLKLSVLEIQAIYFALGKQAFIDYATPDLASAGHEVYGTLTSYVEADDNG